MCITFLNSGEHFLYLCLHKEVSAILQSLNGLLVYYDNATLKHHQPRQDVQSTGIINSLIIVVSEPIMMSGT